MGNMHEVRLFALTVGEWQTHCYVLLADGRSIIVDPAAEPERILAAAAGTTVQSILLTHGHADHVQGLEAVRRATGAPVGVHPADAADFGISTDFDLEDGRVLPFGCHSFQVVHTPGHTRGSVCLRFDGRALVGDTLFPGGPGHSVTPEGLAQIIVSLHDRVFTWPDETAFYPGHGEGGTIGAVRPAFERFLLRPRPPDLCGDVEWDAPRLS